MRKWTNVFHHNKQRTGVWLSSKDRWKKESPYPVRVTALSENAEKAHFFSSRATFGEVLPPPQPELGFTWFLSALHFPTSLEVETQKLDGEIKLKSERHAVSVLF